MDSPLVDVFSDAVHIVVDIETLGKGPRARLVSIGAVRMVLDPVGRMRERSDFYRLISSDGRNAERQTDADTLAWWDKQPWEARAALSVGPRFQIGTALSEFAAWAVGDLSPDEARARLFAWGYGDEFDLALLQDAAEMESRAEENPDAPGFGLAMPWNFRRQGNLRTLAQCFPHVERPASAGIKHNALHDARHEAAYLQALLTERAVWLDVAVIATQARQRRLDLSTTTLQ